MKATLRKGLAYERQITIDRERTISFMGEEGRVYATPELVRDIEVTCRELLLEHVDEGEDSVGTAISIQHSAPTPVGMNVWITVEIVSLQGRLVNLEISAKDEVESICRGTHSRFIVVKAKTVERLKTKGTK